MIHFLNIAFKSIFCISILLFVACSKNDSDISTPQALNVDIISSPNSSAKVIKFKTEQDSIVEYTVTDKAHNSYAFSSQTAASKYSDLLANLPDGANIQIKLSPTGLELQQSQTVSIEQPLLQSFAQNLNLNVMSAANNSDYINVFAATQFIEPEQPQSLLFALDQYNNLVWLSKLQEPVYSIYQTTPASLSLVQKTGVRQINLLGETLKVLKGSRQPQPQLDNEHSLPLDAINYGLSTADSNNPLYIASEIRYLKDQNANFAPTLGEFIFSMDAELNITNRWNMFDVFKQSYPDTNAQLNSFIDYSDIAPRLASDINGIVYVAKHNELIVSDIAQQLTASISTKSSQVNWIIGEAPSSLFSDLVLKPQERGAKFNAMRIIASLQNGDVLVLADVVNGEQTTATLMRLAVDVTNKTYKTIWRHAINFKQTNTNSMIAKHISPQTVLLANKQSLESYVINIDTNDNFAVFTPKNAEAKWQITAAASNIKLHTQTQYSKPKPAQTIDNNTLVDNTQYVKQPLLDADFKNDYTDIAGTWQFTQEQYSNTAQLELKQQKQLITGQLGHQMFTALMKGNVVSFNIRNTAIDKKVLIKYQGVVDASNTQINGLMRVIVNGELIDTLLWQAKKIN